MRIKQWAAEKLGRAGVYKAKLSYEISIEATDQQNVSMTIDAKPIPVNVAAPTCQSYDSD